MHVPGNHAQQSESSPVPHDTSALRSLGDPPPTDDVLTAPVVNLSGRWSLGRRLRSDDECAIEFGAVDCC